MRYNFFDVASLYKMMNLLDVEHYISILVSYLYG
jgi:hypothetical protein